MGLLEGGVVPDFTVLPASSPTDRDFFGNGHSDLLFQNTNGEPYIYEMNGISVIGGGSLANPGPSWHIKGRGSGWWRSVRSGRGGLRATCARSRILWRTQNPHKRRMSPRRRARSPLRRAVCHIGVGATVLVGIEEHRGAAAATVYIRLADYCEDW